MAERPRTEPKYEFIDAARGIAILLVLICHTAVSHEPWPMRRFTQLGWHGVQLFFVVSSMTLALSWHYRRDGEAYPTLNFLVRRIFRIWPMYCLAFIAYLIIWPPTSTPPLVHVLKVLTFMGGWSPPVPTTEDWGGVPGGWSVEDEFAFYLMFPLLVWIASTPMRAILLVLVSLAVAGACNSFLFGHYVGTNGDKAIGQWMYYSFPNQLPVFALGFVAYHAFIRLQPGGAWEFMRPRLLRLCPLLIVIAIAMFLSLGLMPVTQTSRLWPPTLPTHILAGIAFVLGVVAIGLRPYPAIVSWPMVWLGKVSFSVYLVHFAVVDGFARLIPGFFGPSVEGWLAIAASIVLLLATLSVSFAVSLLTYHLVEQPMIARGRLVCRWINRVIASRPAPVCADRPSRPLLERNVLGHMH